ncbi:MAG: peptidoglycan recognition family protein [Rubrivivax sp.]
MAHFVGIYSGIPDPDLDALSDLYVDAAGNGRVGLWGYIDTSTGKACDLRVVSGSGRVAAAGKLGGAVMAFSLAGVSDGAQIQAFSGARPFTAPLTVRRGEGGSLADQNATRLASGDPLHVAQIDGRPVRTIPLTRGFGGYQVIHQLAEVNGLAVHITGGLLSLQGAKNTAESSGASAHFTIDREGNIAQYVALTLMANAQGPGNRNYISVEMVGQGTNDGACQLMSTKQIATLSKLWEFVYVNYPNPPWSLATVYGGDKSALTSPTVGRVSRAMAEELVSLGRAPASAATVNECIASRGLSCHFWLDMAKKPCPGVGIMGQLPQVLGYDEVRVAGDEKLRIPA